MFFVQQPCNSAADTERSLNGCHPRDIWIHSGHLSGTRVSRSFSLDEERIAQVRGCFARERVPLSGPALKEVVSGIENAVARWNEETRDVALEQARRLLWKRVFKELDRDSPRGERLREMVARLPDKDCRTISKNASMWLARQFPRTSYKGDFAAWAPRAPLEELVWTLRTCFAVRSQWNSGRTRANGRRDKGFLEPSFHSSSGGRPRRGAAGLFEELRELWKVTVGAYPTWTRSARTGFGELVHIVFEECGLDFEQALYALRTRFLPDRRMPALASMPVTLSDWHEVFASERNRSGSLLHLKQDAGVRGVTPSASRSPTKSRRGGGLSGHKR